MSDEKWLHARDVLKTSEEGDDNDKHHRQGNLGTDGVNGARLNESVRLVQATEDDSEFRQYRDSVSRIMSIMLLEIMNPLYAEHPELKPPEFR